MVLLLVFLLCGGCRLAGELSALSPPPVVTSVPDDLDQVLDAQLGVLKECISPAERERAMSFLAQLWPLRADRLNQNRYEWSGEEARLIERLNQLYERFTVKYLGDSGGWGYSDPPVRSLAQYRIADGALLPSSGGVINAAYQALWDQMTGLLPDGAFAQFTRFTVFTDGPDETLAYVSMADDDGAQWEIAVDPADAEDGAWFTETILHEYCHYLTLNNGQVDYSPRQTAATYNETGMQSHAGSYLDDFYQMFWTDIIDDRLINLDSYGFFLRHEDDFVTEYASTDPSEDIAESFTYFVIYDRQEGDEIWVQKLNFFYAYPELIQFRDHVRARLGRDAP